MTWTGQHVLRSMRVDVFKQLHRLSLGYYAENDAGNVMSRITNDTDTIQQAIGFALVQVLSGVAVDRVDCVQHAARRTSAYALISLAVVPFMFLATSWLSGQARKAFRKSRARDGQRQRRAAGEHHRRARGAGVQPRETRTSQTFRDVRTRPIAMPTSARCAFTSALAPTLEALGYVAIAIVAGVGGFWCCCATRRCSGTTIIARAW